MVAPNCVLCAKLPSFIHKSTRPTRATNPIFRAKLDDNLNFSTPYYRTIPEESNDFEYCQSKREHHFHDAAKSL